MEKLHNGYTLELSESAFPLSTDSVVLAGFAKIKSGAKVLDLGSGCGTLGLLLCAEHESCFVTGIELDEQAHRMAINNAKTNCVADRLTSICKDIRHVPEFIKPGSFSVCISNPPYFSSGPKSATVPYARRDDLCDIDSLLHSAAWALKYGGDLYMVHRPERLAELFACATKEKLEPKTLLLLHHKEGGPVNLVFVHCRKGAKPGLIWQEEFLHCSNGQPSDFYRKLYHI